VSRRIVVRQTGLVFGQQQAEARRFGIASGVLLPIVLLSPWRVVTALALIALAVSVWKLVFHGATAVSMSLTAPRRNLFQVGVAVAFPLMLSWYFVRSTPTLTVSGVIGHMASAWFLLPIVLIAWVSWVGANQLDQEHPFRGFLIAATALFVICYFGYHGIHSEFDDQTETSSTVIDREAAAQAVTSGRYFGQFLVYVLVSYGVLFAKLRRGHA
jgi:hypothetical protein